MKTILKVLISVFLLVFLAACAAQPPEPTPTEVPPPTDTPLPTETPLPTVNPEWPEEAKIIAEFFKASSEKRADDALSYLAEDVRLNFGGETCFSGKYAKVPLKNAILDPGNKIAIIENYRIDGNRVYVDINEFGLGGIIRETTNYVVIDGLIQWQEDCEPED